MGYCLNRLDEPVFMAGPKPFRTEFGIHLRLESCETRFESAMWDNCHKSHESYWQVKSVRLQLFLASLKNRLLACITFSSLCDFMFYCWLARLSENNDFDQMSSSASEAKYSLLLLK